MPSPKVKAVSIEPEVVVEKKKEEDLVQIIIDKDTTDGGIRINGKLYVGKVKVTQEQADDLQRISEEYFETKKKLFDPTISVRMKNDHQKEVLFLADPDQNSMKKTFSRDYGLLGAREWGFCTPAFKAELLEKRMQMYGY